MITSQIFLNEKEHPTQTTVTYNLSDLLSEKDYNDIKNLAMQICKTPNAEVELIIAGSRFYKSGNDFNAANMLFEAPFFSGNVGLPSEPLIVSDTKTDLRFNKSESISFYARIPFITDEGNVFGTLYITDNQPKSINEEQVVALKSLGRQTVNILQLKIKNLELGKSQERLTGYALEKQNFVYAAAHDLKEPGRVIKAFLKLLENESSGVLSNNAKKYLNEAIDRVEKQDELINDLIEYSTMSIEQKDQRKQTDLSDILKEVTRLLSDLIEQKKVVINVSEMPKIYTVPVAIKQVLQNLITNAIKYQAPGSIPEVSVSAKEESAYWQISVSDNGIGIPAEFLETIFNPLERLHRKDEYPGTGLGLAICKKNIEQLGGKIWVQSEIGKGSIFYFNLPK